MLIRKAYCFRLEPRDGEVQALRRVAGCCRFVWNQALALQIARQTEGLPLLGYPDLCRLLTTWRHDGQTKFLAECPVHTQQQTLKDLSRTLTHFLHGRCGFPRFKKKSRGDHFRYPDPKQFKINLVTRDSDGVARLPTVFLPKIGWVKFRASRDIVGATRNLSITRKADHWFASIQVEVEVDDALTASGDAVGIDLGVRHFATLSNGEMFAPMTVSCEQEKKLAWETRKLARMRYGSRNWARQLTRLQRLHAHLANVRGDRLHKLSTTISKNHAVVVLEDLKIKQMTARNQKSSRRLNRAILAQGWGTFQRMLEYKLRWKGGTTIYVDARNTSRRCYECDHVSAQNRQSQEHFHCECCGHRANADLNAAKNVLRAGHAHYACSMAGP